MKNHCLRCHNFLTTSNLLHMVCGYLSGHYPYWLIQREGIDDDVLLNLERCHIPHCNMFTTSRKNLISHNRCHKNLGKLISDFGQFWGPILCEARCEGSHTSVDYLRTLRSFSCSRCLQYSGSIEGLQRHFNTHDEFRVENVALPAAINTTIFSLVDREPSDSELLIISKKQKMDSRSAYKDIIVDANTMHDSISPTLNKANNHIENSNLAVDPTSEEDDSNDSSATLINRDILLKKSDKWITKEDKDEINGVRFPRLTKKLRSRVALPLKMFFNSEIKNLIYNLRPACDKKEAIITEGILSKVCLLIRKCLAENLRIPLHPRKRDRDLEYSRSSIRAIRIIAMNELTDMLHKLFNISKIKNSAANRNKITSLENNILDIISINLKLWNSQWILLYLNIGNSNF